MLLYRTYLEYMKGLHWFKDSYFAMGFPPDYVVIHSLKLMDYIGMYIQTKP